jgi:AraC family transcriptional regulator, positive regulator of tynA and feaB
MADVRMVSTALVPEKERFAFWRQAIQSREQLAKSRFTLRHGPAFHGSLEYGDLGPLQICKLKVGAHSVDRPRPQAWEKYPRDLVVAFQVKGHAYFEEAGRRVSLSPGEWSLIGMRPWSRVVFMPNGVEQILLTLSREHVAGIHTLENVAASSFSSRNGLGKLLYQFVSATFAELPRLSPQSERSVVATVTELLNYALLEFLGDAPSVSAPEGLHARAQAYILQNLRDPALDVGQVAGAFHCSKRYLHKVFANRPTTISESIWKPRLEGCRADLQNPVMAGRSMTDIAFSWGFNNYTHFSRKFKEAFGMPPRCVRAHITADM